ncbi:ABC transporter substrate-binding protein [Lysinibacter cavernae]|uniref:Peptide/nickel transport system substrate-binding protein n=1 Tax=Lysinibacter cavernae TaxID=1640652 RepID=A0A7X5QZJ5_9MICO|nr:ABC transporter substrate-binding protein [Lysinibacter cavernae]NIH52876.1 peptide/nickel transport system substrate-binding protein [Lysinibacter cavernae]
MRLFLFFPTTPITGGLVSVRPVFSRSSRVTIGAAALASLALLLGGCATGAGADSSGEKTLTFAVSGANVTDGHLDIHKTQIDGSATILRNVFDSLVDVDEDGQAVAWLATDWTVSDDGLEYTFNLRDDVVFHDGEKFNAAAVKANFEHVVDPETESAQALSLLGGDRFEKVEVVDEYTAKLVLNTPFAPLLQNLSYTQLGFYSPKVLDEKKSDLAAGGAGVTVGSGPFTFDELVGKQEIVLKKYADYNWPSAASKHSGPANLDTLVISMLPESSVRVGAVNSGEADVASGLPASAIGELNDSLTVEKREVLGIPYSLYLNDGFGVFADANVRKGFRSSLDIDSAVDTVFFGEFDRAWNILSSNTPGTVPDDIDGSWSFDPEAANAAFDAAGWTERDADGYRTKDGKRLSATWIAWTPVSEENQSLANAFQDDAKKVGFELKRENLEPAQYNEKYIPRTFDLTDWSYSGIDADILRNHLYSEGFQNASTVVRPDIDALLDQAAESTDPAERADLYRQVQEWNNEFIAIIPIHKAYEVTAVGEGVTGLTFDAYGRPKFYSADVS